MLVSSLLCCLRCLAFAELRFLTRVTLLKWDWHPGEEEEAAAQTNRRTIRKFKDFLRSLCKMIQTPSFFVCNSRKSYSNKVEHIPAESEVFVWRDNLKETSMGRTHWLSQCIQKPLLHSSVCKAKCYLPALCKARHYK